MPPTDDIELLRQFVDRNSEDAFATLVERYIGLVHSAALRQTGNPHAAEEITQAVFIILARKAGSLGGKVVLPGWLYQTARLTAANYLRAEIRRARREQEAHMQSTLNESDVAAWQQIAPLLDTAMGGLNESDRNAIVLRFFENKSMDEIAATLGAPEATVRKRVTRAVERLRKFFTQRGVTLTAAAIAGAVSANSVQAAPVGLAATVIAAKTASATALASLLAKATLKTMVWAKAKIAIGITAAAVVVAGGAAVLVSNRADRQPPNPSVVRGILQGAFARISAPLPAQMRFIADLKEIPRPYTEGQARKEAKNIQDDVRKHESTVPGLRDEDLVKQPPRMRAQRERQQAELMDLQTESVLWAHRPRTYHEQEWLSGEQWRLDQLETTPKPEKLEKATRPLPKEIAYERTFFKLAETNAPDERSFQIDHRLQSVWFSKTGWARTSLWQAGTLEPMIGFLLTMILSDLREVANLAQTKSKTEKAVDSFAGVKLNTTKLDDLAHGKNLVWNVETDEVTDHGRKLAVLRLKGRTVGLAHGAEVAFFADATNLANIHRIEVTAMPSLLPGQSTPYISVRDNFDTNGFPHLWTVETPNDKWKTKRIVNFKEVEFPAKFDDDTVFHPEIPPGYQVHGRTAR